MPEAQGTAHFLPDFLISPGARGPFLISVCFYDLVFFFSFFPGLSLVYSFFLGGGEVEVGFVLY